MTYFALNRPPDSVFAQTEEELSKLSSTSSNAWQGKAVVVQTQIHGDEQHVLVRADVPLKRVALRWQLQVTPGLSYLGDHWERGYADMEWRGLVPERVMPWYFLACDGTVTHGYGVKTGTGSLCFWQVDTDGVTLWLDVRNGSMGVQLGERELLAAEIVTRKGQEGERAFQAAQNFCQLLCPQPVLPEQPIYGGNNWYYAYGNSSHQEILDDTKLIADLAPSSENRPFMVIDDGWQLCHSSSCNGGPWHAGNYLFPDMQRLTTEMKELGARPGLWFRPLLTVEKVPNSWLYPQQRFNNITMGVMLDPSVPEVRERVSQDIQRMAGWGFELLKHDFSTYDIFGKWGLQMGKDPVEGSWSFNDRTKTTAEIIRTFYRDIAQAAGQKAVIIGCNTIGHLTAGLFAIQRTGDDTSGWEWERTRRFGVNTLAFRMPQHNTFFASDADCVGLTRHIPWELNRQWLDLLARSGTPLFVSASPDAVGPEQRTALRAAFAVAAQQRPPAEPLDWMHSLSPAQWRIDGETVTYHWYGETGVTQF